MSLIRAMMVNAEAAQIQDHRMDKLLDKKEAENESTKKLNNAFDVLQELRNKTHDVTDTSNPFDAEEKEVRTWDTASRNEMDAAAVEAGVTLTDGDYGALAEVKEGEGNTQYLRIEGDADATWVKERQEALDKIEKKLERALNVAQDATKMTDLKLNMSMNSYSQKLKDANGAISTIKDLESDLTLGR